METVPCIIADDLTEEQIKAYRLADNKVAEQAEWDIGLLGDELADILDIDMTDFGFDLSEEEEEQPTERKDLSEKVGETYEVIIECDSEEQQAEIYERVRKEGLSCRVLTL
jgi:ParB-like chromosome segregation protein Spo0J